MHYSRKFLFLCALLSLFAINCEAADVETVVNEICSEITKPNADPDGRPLPVVSHRANGFGRNNFSSDHQTELIERGHHIVSTLPMPIPHANGYDEKGREIVKKLAACRAPCEGLKPSQDYFQRRK